MSKLEEAKEILRALGMPKAQQNDRSGYVFLSLANIKEDEDWSNASNPSKRITDMRNYMADYYGKVYAENTRETLRKDSIHQFVAGALAVANHEDENRATNSGKYSYRLTEEALKVVKSYGTSDWDKNLENWLDTHKTLMEQYSQNRELKMIPVVINGQDIKFSPGKHNELQKSIITEFAPRFAQGAEVLYVGDTKKRDLVKNRKKLEELGINITDHDKLPDVVLYVAEKNWLYFIEAVTSVGPISVKRVREIEAMLGDCSAGIVYVTAFLDMSGQNGFKKFIDQIAWETEVWIADQPDHLIHLNGDRFFGPRNN